jgi:Uma2 family endonuclease
MLPYLSAERFQQADPEGNIRGAADIVVEVLSPSNTVAEIYDKEKLWLENGAGQFWVVDLDRRQVMVPESHPGMTPKTYSPRLILYRCGERWYPPGAAT